MVAEKKTESAAIRVTPELLTRYDKPGPRYTSYPTAPEWRDDFGDEDYRKALADAATRPDEELSFYVHVPFCEERCKFCGCNVVISKHREVTEPYLAHVAREVAMTAEALGDRRRIMQLHWGGGTPTYLTPSDIKSLYRSITEHFTLDPDAEVGLEIDPRVTSLEQISVLRELGFNRISMGVQDLDAGVQEAVGRNQTEEETRRLFGWCREAGFEGINIDLVYGLPRQTLEGWTKTLESIIEIHPDRLAVYSFAHLPKRMKHQAHMDATAMPTGSAKLDLLVAARDLFMGAGYRAIGMDHFAAPDDELSLAVDERRLNRNFMGYTVVQGEEMIGVGPSSIGEIGGCYTQNHKRLVYYYRALDEGRLAAASGWFLSDDDAVRRWVIRQLMCNLYLDTAELKRRFGVEYDAYFEAEEEELRALYDEDFIAREGANIKVLPLGQVFIRNVAMVFDAYLKTSSFKAFSRTV